MAGAETKAKNDFAVMPGQDAAGAPVFSMLAKRTYDIVPGQAARRADKDQPLRQIDEYWERGDARTATVMHEADIAPFKALTDVVFVGKALAPAGKAVYTLDVGLQVEGVGAKIVRVIGSRKCRFQAGRPPLFTDPEPFTEMDIRYDLAYGGKDKRGPGGQPWSYPRNDMGKGVALKNIRESVDGLELPNLEDPADLLRPETLVLDAPEAWPRMPMPAGLGWFQRTWYPRSFFAGAAPGHIAPGTVTKEEYLGYVMKDHIALAKSLKLPGFHPRFLQGASPGLAFPPLSGGESIKLKGLTTEGMLQFRLPGEVPRLVLDIGFGPKTMEPALHTVIIRGEDRQVDLVWRGSQAYPGVEWLAEMKTLEAEVA
jgi:hypothetical protein